MSPDTSIIISTYNSPEWLEKVFHGYNNQTYRNFEVVLADDGSGSETRELIERMKKEVFYPIVHVWHEDDGFQKSRILNKAIVQCAAEYIIMSDGDCIPRKDFVEQHVKHREKGYFLSGGYFMLPMPISKQITPEDIYTGRCFSVSWLKKNGLKTSFKNNKLTASAAKSYWLNRLTPTNASWNGHNASGWKKDIVAVNGFDERMQYGGQDRELGERLENSGIKSKQIRYNAVVVHLDHPRGYKNQRSIDKNLCIRKYTKQQKVNFTPYGIVKDAVIPFQTTVILEVRENSKWLKKILSAYKNQVQDNFEIILAGNLSKEEIGEFQESLSLNIRYVDTGNSDWILKAIEAANSDYLLFTNDRALPRYDFIAVHAAWRKPRYFITTGIIEVSDDVFNSITEENIISQTCFEPDWLENRDVKKSLNWQALSNNKIKKSVLNQLATSFTSMDKTDFSAFKKDMLHLDKISGKSIRQLREQIGKSGIQPIRIPFSTLVLRVK